MTNLLKLLDSLEIQFIIMVSICQADLKKIEKSNGIILFFIFVGNKPISQPQLWSKLISFSKEICKIFTDIINSNEIKKIRHYTDPAE